MHRSAAGGWWAGSWGAGGRHDRRGPGVARAICGMASSSGGGLRQCARADSDGGCAAGQRGDEVGHPVLAEQRRGRAGLGRHDRRSQSELDDRRRDRRQQLRDRLAGGGARGCFTRLGRGCWYRRRPRSRARLLRVRVHGARPDGGALVLDGRRAPEPARRRRGHLAHGCHRAEAGGGERPA